MALSSWKTAVASQLSSVGQAGVRPGNVGRMAQRRSTGAVLTIRLPFWYRAGFVAFFAVVTSLALPFALDNEAGSALRVVGSFLIPCGWAAIWICVLRPKLEFTRDRVWITRPWSRRLVPLDLVERADGRGGLRLVMHDGPPIVMWGGSAKASADRINRLLAAR